jgi:2-C-methyl-D-erythritol 4-phosphate cytidylyltransferase
MPGSESEGTHLQGSVWVAVPAAGSGARMGGATPKQYLPLAGKPLAVHTLTALLAVKGIREIVVAIAPADSHWSKLPAPIRLRVRVVDGGPTRAVSVLNALRGFSVTPDPDDWVLVHDMARPCVRPERIVAMVRELACDAVGGLLAVPLVDTLKRADEAQRVTATLGPRGIVACADTPDVPIRPAPARA